jgi:hypothetical protein
MVSLLTIDTALFATRLPWFAIGHSDSRHLPENKK